MTDEELHKFYCQLKQEVQYLNAIWSRIEQNKLQNEQEILDFQDALNEISIRN